MQHPSAKSSINRVLLLTLLLLFSSPLWSHAKISELNLINIAGKQRMLSQRIAKDYLYIHKEIALSKTEKELQISLKKFFNAQKILVDSIKNEEIQNLLSFVKLSSNDLNQTLHQSFSLDNAQLILDLTESILEGNQYIVDSLKNSIKIEGSQMIELAGRGRMMAQRIAKYYIAYQIGIQDLNTIRSMKQTISKFNKILKQLSSHPKNTPLIQKKIDNLSTLWKIVHNFYNNIERGGLPLIVLSTTDKITLKMNEITHLYLSLQK